MPYESIEDIPNIGTSRINIKNLDPMLYRVIESTIFALDRRYNFNKRINDERPLIEALRGQLLLYTTTHKSIRLLLAHAYRKKDYPIVTDATSLVREQVEKIYTIVLFLDNPHKWIKHYLRSAWRTDYETYLLEMDEHGNNPRYQEFLLERYPKFLKGSQRPIVGRNKTETIVSDFAKRAIKWKWDNPTDEKPLWFVTAQKRKKKKPKITRVRNYIKEYFEFPTPYKAATLIRDPQLRNFLFRWHREYSFICQYSHVALDKLVIPMMNEHKDMFSPEKMNFAAASCGVSKEVELFLVKLLVL